VHRLHRKRPSEVSGSFSQRLFMSPKDPVTASAPSSIRPLGAVTPDGPRLEAPKQQKIASGATLISSSTKKMIDFFDTLDIADRSALRIC
jgi:hypothetical protein